MADSRLPPGQLTNPAAMVECRRRGWPMTPRCFADAARLAAVPLYVRESDETMREGLAEIQRARRQAGLRRQSKAFLLRNGLLEKSDR